MSPDPEIAALVDLLEGPAAVYDDRGQLLSHNAAFGPWAGLRAAGRLDRRSDGVWLVALDRAPVAVRAEPLAGGRWLVLGGGDALRLGIGAVATTVVRRLDRVMRSLDANLSTALRERPADDLAAVIREALADVDELRALRRHVAGLVAEPAAVAPQAVNLPALTREAVLALSGPPPVAFEEAAGDAHVALAVREQLFAAIAALVGVLCRVLPSSGQLVVTHVSLGNRVGVVFRADPRFLVPVARLDLEAARSAASVAGARLLVETEGSVVLELPAFEAGSGRQATGGRGLILLADDDPSVLAMMGAVLRQAGFSVIEADNGVAACSLVRTHGPELGAVVTDAVLPGCSGIEVVAEVRRTMPRLPVLLITGHDEDLVSARGIPILRKPFGARAFRERVEGVIAGARAG